VNPKDFDRIRFITRHFKELKGLERDVPTGLLGLGMGINRLTQSESSFLPLLLLFACILGSFLLRHRAGSYYRAIFGEVEQPQKSPIPWGAYLLVLMISALVFLEGGGLRNDVIPRLFLSAYSATFICRWIWRGYRRSQWLAFVILLLGAQPLVSIVPGRDRLGFVVFLGGASTILGGLLDHRFLVREMGKLAAPPHETAAAAELERQR